MSRRDSLFVGRRSAYRRGCQIAFLIVAFATSPASAETPSAPPYYAVRDVRVVQGAGAPLEKATVLVADGLIEAVGADLEIPADAWVIEGSGLTLFPGLVDALTELGQSSPEEPAGRPGASARPGSSAPPVRGPQDRPLTTPWVNAADRLASDDERIGKWREAGFTTVVTAPADGLFSGQAALINLAGDEPRDRVVATPVAQRVDWSGAGGFRTYPGSLMGKISYVKQVFSDADHYSRSSAIYEGSPAGRERPQYDRTLAPIADAIADGTPFLLPASLAREIDRALDLAEEYRLPAILYGGQGAYSRLEALKRSGVPVLVSLDWPEAPKNSDPEADTPFRTHYHRRLAPMTPAKLAAAGVPFAFYSDGLSSASKVFEKVRGAVEAGLSDQQALEAMTVGVARIFGAENRLGTIEPGKIANMVLASDFPWAEDAEIKAVFVDGRKFEKRAEREAGEPPASNVGGTWKLTLESSRGSREVTADLEMSDDGKVTGELAGERGTRTVDDGRMSGSLLSFKATAGEGASAMEASFSLTVEGDELAGTMSAGPMMIDVTGARSAAASADSDREEEAPTVSVSELEEMMAVYQGPVKRMDRFAITNARIYTVSGQTLERGAVLVEGGKIRAVGSDLRIPRGFEIIDARGGSLIPGIIDAHSHVAIDGGGNEGSLTVTSMVTIQDVLNPDDVAIYRALAGGVTAANILHGSANPIGGGNAVIKLRWGSDADGLRFVGAPPGIKFALGENPKRSNFRPPGGQQRYPATRMGVMDVIRQAFTEASEYQREWAGYEAAVLRRQQPMPPRRDFKLERLVEILEGKRWVHSHCYRADEILQLLRLAEEFGFRIRTLQHVLEGYKIADEIAAHGAGASTFSDWWGYKVEAYGAIPHNAALMTERGVIVSINSDSAEEMRHLNQEAAKAMKWGGLDEVAALRLVTLNPAIQLGIAERVGSIEVGKDADLVLYDGPPLSMFSVVQKTFVDGDLYFELEADRHRQQALDEIKAKLEPEKDDQDPAEEIAERAEALDDDRGGDQGEAPEMAAKSPASADADSEAFPALVLEGGTIHPFDGAPYEGRVVIAGGVIRAVGGVGGEVEVPAGTQTLDVSGLHVFPGFFDAFSQLGLVEVNAVAATVDTTELGRFNPHLSAATAIHPASEVIPVTRANGVTHSLVAPLSGNEGVIPGQGAVVHLAGWTVEEMAVGAPPVLVINWPAIQTRRFDFSTFSIRTTPFNEAEEKAEKAQGELREWLAAARQYRQARSAENSRAQRDLKLEALASVLDGGRRVVIVANEEREIRGAVEFADEEGLDIVIAGGRDAWKTKDLLSSRAIPVILGLTQDLPANDDDPYDRPFRTAAELVEAGVKIAFGSGAGGGFGPGGPHVSRTLPYEAAMAAAYGLNEQETLKALTVYPAEIFGLGDRLGSIEAGKVANLIVTDGSPLEITTGVHHLIIDGEVVSTANLHRSSYERYRARP